MGQKKRIFLFAAYSPSGKAGVSLRGYLEALSRLGNVVFCADSPLEEEDLGSIGKYVLHAEALHHAQYDFGSYKRDWEWAKGNLKDLTCYDFLYLVNDSVFGPVRDLEPLLEDLENQGRGAFGLVYNPHRKAPHLQSWFVGLRKEVFSSVWFDTFLRGVSSEGSKSDVCQKYETGLTALLRQEGVSLGYAFTAPHKSIYNSPLKYVREGLPFVKKSSFTRHGGSLGRQIAAIAREFPSPGTEAMLEEARATFGKEYMDHFLSQSPLEAIKRKIHYLYGKLAK